MTKKSVFIVTVLMIATIIMTFLVPTSNAIYFTHASLEQPQVLVLNAYNRGFSWTDNQTDAIIDVLEASSLQPIYYIEYLDWKRQSSQTNLQYQADLLLHKYRKNEIDIIIATDDIGMQFAIDYRDEIAPNAPIVFTAVFEASAMKRMEGVENITGVYESIDPYGTMEMILELHKDLEHLYIINEDSESGRDVENEILEAVLAYQATYDYTYELLSDHSYDEIDEALKKPVSNSVVIIGTHNSDRLGDALPNEIFTEELASWIDIPIYSPYEFLFDHGIVGGSLLSGRLQGTKGAELALRIINGESADDIQEYTEKTVYYGIDYVYAEEHQLDLDKLTMDYTLINKPISIFEQYRTAILMGLGIIAILSFFIVMLSINIRIRKKAQYQLELKHDELLETYEALAASEEELKVQNEELIEQQREIQLLAYFDKLTKLPNKNAIELEVEHMIQSDSNEQIILLIVGVDNLNYINTAYGYDFGNELLKYVAKKLIELRDLGYYVGRNAGDEFFVMKKMEANETEKSIVMKIDDVFSELLLIDNKEILISKSVGYSIFPDDGENYNDLMSRTDMAKKMMKQKGTGMTSRFVSSMSQEMSDRISLTRALKTAVREKELYVVFQPKYDLSSESIVGLETLVRWTSESVGEVSPATFIPLAEEIGEIIDIGYFVLEEAMKFLSKNLNYFAPDFKLSVNISVLQLIRLDFIERVEALVELYDIPPTLLEFEIAESILSESFEIINDRLIRLKMIGITIALDDCGTGYFSLSNLKGLPISTLKIDRIFIKDIIREGIDHFFTNSIIDIAKGLGLKVVAVGVEVDRQVDYLKDCGSTIIQGSWFSEPLEEGLAIKLYLDHKAHK